jgi:hypothetical protein
MQWSYQKKRITARKTGTNSQMSKTNEDIPKDIIWYENEQFPNKLA